jgi:REP element-mobilizing transposase RayT
MKSRQISLFTNETKKRYSRTAHGGAETRGKRKLERPLSTKGWVHLVLKSDKARGQYGFLLPKNHLIVHQIVQLKANKFGVRIAKIANVGNHIHLKIRITSRASFQKFLKSVTALIARKVTGARKGKPFGRFWQGLAFTRVLKSRCEEWNLDRYINSNRQQARVTPAMQLRYLDELNRWILRQATLFEQS